MDRQIGVIAAGWAAATLALGWQDALAGAWLGVGCIALAPAAVWALARRPRADVAALRAADAEAAAWRAPETHAQRLRLGP
jgi:hypothetical protein